MRRETMSGFCGESIEYRSYLGEDGDYNAVYAKYTLDGAAVREVFAVDEEAVDKSGVTVYYFPERCRCTDSDGNYVSLPRPKGGDMCVLRQGCENERVMRVAEVGYFTGSAEMTHIRLKLK